MVRFICEAIIYKTHMLTTSSTRPGLSNDRYFIVFHCPDNAVWFGWLGAVLPFAIQIFLYCHGKKWMIDRRSMWCIVFVALSHIGSDLIHADTCSNTFKTSVKWMFYWQYLDMNTLTGKTFVKTGCTYKDVRCYCIISMRFFKQPWMNTWSH